MELYIRVRGRTHGPFRPEKLASLISRGQVTRATMVSEDGQSWKKAAEYPEIFDFADAQKATKDQQQARETAEAAATQRAAQGHQANEQERRDATNQPEEWYYTLNDQPQGPVTFETLRTLIDTGGISNDTMIWANHMATWEPAKDVPQVAPLFQNSFPQVSPAVKGSRTATNPPGQNTGEYQWWYPPGSWVKSWIESLGQSPFGGSRDQSWRGAAISHAVGSVMLLPHLFLAVLLAAKQDIGSQAMFTVIFQLIALFIFNFVGNYIVHSMRHPIDSIVNNPYSIRSFTAFYCISGIFLFGSIALLIATPAVCVVDSGVRGFALAFAGFVVAFFGIIVSRIFANPAALGFKIDDTARISEDAIGIMASHPKVLCVLVPYYITAVNILGVIGILISDVAELILIGDTSGTPNMWLLGIATLGYPSLALLISGGFIALAVYLQSIFVLLGLDVLEAVFRGVRYLGKMVSSE